jgi:hypothetical protein
MDPVTLAASVVSGLLVEAFKEGSKILAPSGSKAVHGMITYVREKLSVAGTGVLLERVEHNPTPRNIEVLKGEIIEQMTSDQSFLTQIQLLLEQIKFHDRSPQAQKILSDLEDIGNIKIGNIKQSTSGELATQVILENIRNAKNIEIGDITQEN